MIHHRRAGRVIFVAPDHSTLLVLGQDPQDLARGSFYWTPGGGVDADETVSDAARREVREELGYAVGELGPVVLEREAEFDFGGRRIRQVESFYLVGVPDRFTPEPDALTELEADAILGFDWMTPDRMRNSQLSVYPVCLPDLVEFWAADGHPETAWREHQ
ncbi:MAG: 8-oxo-dGTP pyrophosphatase MutT (NUDIX family) [Verrucomicrobiales bacterium]|jgi:8-oxo-dGTP pyrophosphatase MutT (NUDIX family)